MKKLLSILIVFLTVALLGCATAPETPAPTGAPINSAAPSPAPAKPGAGETVYFLNFKPEIADAYKALADAYREETGVTIKVETAASGTYEQTLKSEIAKSDPPVIFQINGPVGYAHWKEYCRDLADSELYGWLTDKSLAITGANNGVYGVPYVVEGYGIIYNKSIMEKYFGLDGAKAKTMDDIKSFDTLKAVVEDMQAKKAQLGIQGVFSSTSLAAGNQWRWQTHLMNIPVYYELQEVKGEGDATTAGLAAGSIAFKYAENFKNIFDLYVKNSCTDRGMLGAKSVDDAMAEFALGRSAMVQNGNWGASQILGVEGNTVKEDDIRFLPIYTGMTGEEKAGLCIGTENYFAINAKAAPAKQEAALGFLSWMFSSEVGKKFVTEKLGIAPFTTFGENDHPADPLGKEVARFMAKEGVTNIPWVFQAFPSEAFKNYFGDALLEYVQGTKTWDDVKAVVVDKWAAERAANPVL